MPNESLAERLNQKLSRLFVALVFVYVIISSFRPVMDNVDIGWHVAQGRWMVEHFSIYRHDVFSYPNLGRPVLDEYPLFQVVLYAAHALGWWGPCLLTSLVYATLIAILLRAANSLDLAASALVTMSIGLMLLFFQVAVPLRPHMVTYLGVVITGVFLLRHRNATSWTTFWPLALLQIAWANSHSGFVIGPIMVGLFGAEMTLRCLLQDKSLPWRTALVWLGAFLFVLLACLVNPFGYTRFYPPIFQDQLESIRAYVGEMEPLTGAAATLAAIATFAAAFVIILAMIRSRIALSFSFLILAILFHQQALAINKAWSIFGLFVPLVVLSTGAFATVKSSRPLFAWPSVLGHFLVVVVTALALWMRLAPSLDSSLQKQWQEYDHGRSELSIKAAEWMKANSVEGRLFHRCEDGGLLQIVGLNQTMTSSDTGFGKYDEAFIHEVGLTNERPAMVPHYLDAYHPSFIVCSTFCYQWPYYLRLNGWRLIFYTPNSSVWTRPEIRPDLPTVTDDTVTTTFDQDLAAYGRPGDNRLYGRSLIALNSMGLEDFAFAKLKELPADSHHAPWYWEAARFLCFAEPRFSLEHRDALLLEAEQLHDDNLTAEFRAYCRYASSDIDGALHILENIPQEKLGNYSAELLLKIYLDRKRPEALALARRNASFDLRNGRHWQYLAEAEERAGNRDAAASAWRKAVFYYPDDSVLMETASQFADKYHDRTLVKAIADSMNVYGPSSP